jgi:outer membrane protein OmpA-like peptidoglycan-associated protein
MIRTVSLGVLVQVFASAPAVAMKPAWSTDILFSSNSDVIEQVDLERLSYSLSGVPAKFPCPSGNWIVVGHADRSEGTKEESAALSKRRVEAVATAMRRAGIQVREIDLASKGASQPVAKPPHPRNRRVEIEYAPCEASGG